MPMCEVAVTGIGMVTSLGSTAAETVAAWQSGASAEFFPEPLLAGTPLENICVARRPAFDVAKRLGGRRMLKFMSEAARLGCVAAREACQQARLRERCRAERIGLFAGTGLAAASVEEARPMLEASIGTDGHFSCAELGTKGLSAANPLLSFKILANMPPCLISIIEGIKGPNLIFSPWEAQAAEALIEAWRAVAEGEVDAALAGAADHPAHPATIVYLRQSGRLKPDECPAPAGAYVVLESAEKAARDGQKVLAVVEDIGICEESEAVSSSTAEDPERAPRVEGRGVKKRIEAGGWRREKQGAGARSEERERSSIADRLGRSFAAEPAVFLALAALPPAVSSQQHVASSHQLSNGRSLRIRLRAPE